MLGSRTLMKRASSATPALSSSASASSASASAIASNTTACCALFLFTFLCGSLPAMMRRSTAVSARSTPASSGGGKYCSTRRHLTCRAAPASALTQPARAGGGGRPRRACSQGEGMP